MGSGEPLAGLVARLASKVAKAEARQGLVPAPESALNFRPAVSHLFLPAALLTACERPAQNRAVA